MLAILVIAVASLLWSAIKLWQRRAMARAGTHVQFNYVISVEKPDRRRPASNSYFTCTLGVTPLKGEPVIPRRRP